MEEQRLKDMGEYDVALFKKLYNEVMPLKKNLAAQINPHRFGVDYQEILSWFDVKFIFVFGKHHKEFPENRLKAYLLNSLSVYKNKILRRSYQRKYDVYKAKVDIDTPAIEYEVDSYTRSPEVNYLRDFQSIEVRKFMRNTLSEEAFWVFEIQMELPPYIIKKMNEKGCKDFKNVPNQLIAEYLDLLENEGWDMFIKQCKDEIKQAEKAAKIHFK